MDQQHETCLAQGHRPRLGLWSLGLISLLTASQIATAQTAPNPVTTRPSLDNVRSPQVNDPVSQPFSLPDRNRSSGQFFEQGRENLFFLPEESANEILKIDDSPPDKSPKSDEADTPSETEETAQ